MTAIAATTLPRPRRGLHVGLALVALLLLMALLGPWLSPYDPTLVNPTDMQMSATDQSVPRSRDAARSNLLVSR